MPTSLFAQPGPNDVFVRVVDSGAALCCVVKMPGNRFMIYDAGNYSIWITASRSRISSGPTWEMMKVAPMSWTGEWSPTGAPRPYWRR